MLPKKLSLQQIEEQLADTELVNYDSQIHIEKIAGLESREGGNFISLVAAKTKIKQAQQSQACAFLTTAALAKELDKPCLVCQKPEFTLIALINILYGEIESDGIIAQTAVVHEEARIGVNTSIGDYAVIGANSQIGANCMIGAGVKIGKNVVIGDHSRIEANCVIFDRVKIGKRFIMLGNATVGGDGYKFVPVDGIYHKVPHHGSVRIGDDVELGSNSCIDRGSLQDTVIGDGCKFDNHVHIGHNCMVGKNVVMAGQSGLAGSVTVADNVIIGGACAIADHIELPAGTILGGGSAFRTPPKKPGFYAGWDFGLLFSEFQKLRVNIKHLVNFQQWIRRIKAIEKKLGIEEEKK